MDRQFEARITSLHMLYFLILGGLTFYGMCIGSLVLILLGGTFLLLAVERSVHTKYIIKKSGNIFITRGRFTKETVISIASVEDVKKSAYMTIGNQRIHPFVRIDFSNNRYVDIHPQNEDEFIRCLKKRMELEADY